MNRRPGQIEVVTEVGYCPSCGRTRNLRREEHHLGQLVRTIVTCETCHRTLSSSIGVASEEPVTTAPEPKLEPAPVQAVESTVPAAAKAVQKVAPAKKKTAPAVKPAARKPSARKPAARKPAIKKPAAKKPAGKPTSTASRKPSRRK